MTEERDFEDLLFDLWTQARTEGEVRAAMEQLGDSFVAARAQYQKTREHDEALFGQDFVAD